MPRSSKVTGPQPMRFTSACWRRIRPAAMSFKAGDKPKAIDLARRALALAPDDPIVNDTLGWILFQSQGATPEVIVLMRKAYAGQPANQEIQSHIAQISSAARKNSN